jgi:hypothetical protein
MPLTPRRWAAELIILHQMLTSVHKASSFSLLQWKPHRNGIRVQSKPNLLGLLACSWNITSDAQILPSGILSVPISSYTIGKFVSGTSFSFASTPYSELKWSKFPCLIALEWSCYLLLCLPGCKFGLLLDTVEPELYIYLPFGRFGVYCVSGYSLGCK